MSPCSAKSAKIALKLDAERARIQHAKDTQEAMAGSIFQDLGDYGFMDGRGSMRALKAAKQRQDLLLGLEKREVCDREERTRQAERTRAFCHYASPIIVYMENPCKRNK